MKDFFFFLGALLSVLFQSAFYFQKNEIGLHKICSIERLLGSPQPPREIHVNMGSQHGVRVGSILEVFRRNSIYDAQNNEFQGDFFSLMTTLKVIKVGPTVSQALEDIHQIGKIMVGDYVKLKDEKKRSIP